MPRISAHIYIVYVIYNIKNDNFFNMTEINKHNIIIIIMQLVETLGLSWKSGYWWNYKMYVHCTLFTSRCSIMCNAGVLSTNNSST